MTETYIITERDRRVLELISRYETSGSNSRRYNTVNGAGTISGLVDRTIRSVINEFGTSAKGRYQFADGTLGYMVTASGINQDYRFSPQVQDYLALTLLRSRCGYNDWKNGTGTDRASGHSPNLTRDTWDGPSEDFFHAVFLLRAAMQWAALPIPIRLNPRTVRGNVYQRPRDSSYWAGPSNAALGGNAATHIAELKAIYNQGEGASTTVNLNAPPSYQGTPETEELDNVGVPPEYFPRLTNEAGSLRDIRNRGAGYISPTSRGFRAILPTVSSPMAGLLPSVTNPYVYKRKDPLDNRYDFRTGEKVIDLLINGTNPISSFPISDERRRLGDPGRTFTPTDEEQTPDRYDLDLNSVERSETGFELDPPPEGVDPSNVPEEVFDASSYIVRNIVPNGGTNGSNVAIIGSANNGRLAEYAVGEILYYAPPDDSTGAPGESIIITEITADGIVRLSNGDILTRVSDTSDAAPTIDDAVDNIEQEEINPPEDPAGDYAPVAGSMRTALSVLNSLAQQTSARNLIVPFVYQGAAYFISADYFRDTDGRYPEGLAFAPPASNRPDPPSVDEYQTALVSRSRSQMPPIELMYRIETAPDGSQNGLIRRFQASSARATRNPDSGANIQDPALMREVNNGLDAYYRENGVQRGQIITGTKKVFGINASGGSCFLGFASGGGLIQGNSVNGTGFGDNGVHGREYADYSHAARLYYGGIVLQGEVVPIGETRSYSQGNLFGVVAQLVSSSDQR